MGRSRVGNDLRRAADDVGDAMTGLADAGRSAVTRGTSTTTFQRMLDNARVHANPMPEEAEVLRKHQEIYLERFGQEKYDRFIQIPLVLPQQDVSRHFAIIADQDQRVVDAAFTHPLHGPQWFQFGRGESFGQVGLVDPL